MQKYQRTYFVGMGYDLKDLDQNNLRSEISGQKASDIHHLKLGCSLKRQDYPVERLMMLTRHEHVLYGDKKQWYDFLFWMHILEMESRNIKVNTDNMPSFLFEVSAANAIVMEDFWIEVMSKKISVSITESNTGYVADAFISGGLIDSKQGITKFEALTNLVI